MRVVWAKAFPASLPRLRSRWSSKESLLLDMPFLNMVRAKRRMFQNFLATTGAFASAFSIIFVCMMCLCCVSERDIEREIVL